MGTAPHSTVSIDKDSRERIVSCIHTLLNPRPTAEIFLKKSREAFAFMLQDQLKKSSNPDEKV